MWVWAEQALPSVESLLADTPGLGQEQSPPPPARARRRVPRLFPFEPDPEPPGPVLLDKHLPVHTAPAAVNLELVVTAPAGSCLDHHKEHQTIRSILKLQQQRRRTKPSSRPSTRCQICQKSFAKPGLLRRHQLIHTGEKPFKCEICDRAFNQKSALKIHRESKHGKIRPYQCTICKMFFAQRGNLRNHVRRVHNLSEARERIFKCEHCGCGFATSGVLGSHISKMHDPPSNTGMSADALRDLVRQLLDYSAGNAAARDRIQAQIQEIARSGVVPDCVLPAAE
ncbi:zinc finger protein Xfin-like, partial [Pollicipes pollicipes]|uniref:zinc finger protein Xfin-like n=1 Tax=Pollicipes pollicipes TaxID=41117 RepID=UPI0018854C20